MGFRLPSLFNRQPSLDTYNQVLLDYQDQAYTLAYYLLGSEKDAMAALQLAVEGAFRESNGKTDSIQC